MKRYLLFGFLDYYPGGGWSDFKGDFDDLEEAKRNGLGLLDPYSIDEIEVVDLQTGEVVFRSRAEKGRVNMEGLTRGVSEEETGFTA